MASGDHDRWLSHANEVQYNMGIRERHVPDSSALSCFLTVASRYQPLIPSVLIGPVEDLQSRVILYWDSHARRDSFLYQEKRQMAIATADRISHIAIAHTIPPDEYSRLVMGHQFFQRPSQPTPFEIPLYNTRPSTRTELNEVLWILMILFHSVGLYFPPHPAPEGIVAYIPYYSTNVDMTSPPKRQRVASLAHASMFFRRYAGLPAHKQAFSLFTFTRTSITPPQPEQTTPLSKSYYLQGSGVGVGSAAAKERTPLESGISYFVAKLMEIRDTKAEVRALSTRNP
jgi:hypothetical protein